MGQHTIGEYAATRPATSAPTAWSVNVTAPLVLGTREPITSCADMRDLDRDLARRFLIRCIEEGFYFHTDFSVSEAHAPEVLDDVLERMERIATEPGW